MLLISIKKAIVEGGGSRGERQYYSYTKTSCRLKFHTMDNKDVKLLGFYKDHCIFII